MIRVFLILLLPFYLFGQEVYPAQSPCFCVPTIELNWDGTSIKQDKIELIYINHAFAGGLGTTEYYDSTFIRDNTNSAWASTDYYNQAINDTITQRMRRFAVALKPQLGTEDDIGFVFNTRTKDRPNFLAPNQCDANIGTNVSLNHKIRIMLAMETINSNYRQGNPVSSTARTTGYSMKFEMTAGSVITEVVISNNTISSGDPGGWAALIKCPTCATRWGTDPDAGNFTGYFTERSLSKIWRNNRNTFKMTNAGFWPGQVPYTGYLEKGNRRCQTFASFTCTDLDSTRNNLIADRIIANQVRGTCLPECGTCDALGRGYFNYRPYVPCPTPSNGALEYIIPNGASLTGTWCYLINTPYTGPGSCAPYGPGGGGSLPATSITLSNALGSLDNGNRYIVRLLTTNPTCQIDDTIDVFSATWTGNCVDAPISGINYISNQPVRGSCFGSENGYLINRFAANTGVDSIGGTFGSVIPYKAYIEYQNINQADVPSAAGNVMYTARVKKGNLIASYSFSYPDKLCPCTRNRYIVFNKAYASTTGFGISAWRKTALENLGWTVLP